MNGRLVPRAEVEPRLAAAMHRLLRRHFAGVTVEGFLADLEEKNWVVVLEDGRGELVGFTTLLVYEERRAGVPLTVVYSGDTIVHRAAWRSALLPRTWIRAVRELHERRGAGTLWWLLATSGFRTYRFLPVFCRDFHPRHDAPPDGATSELLGWLARRRFGERYDPQSGIVRLPRAQRLRRDLREVPAGREVDPHVAFFLRRNPGHARGDELVCLARLDDANLTPAGLRMLYGAPGRGVVAGRRPLPLRAAGG